MVRPEDENLKPKEQEEEAFGDYLKSYAPSGFEFQETPGKPCTRESRLDTVRRKGVWYMPFTASLHEGGMSEFTASRPLTELMHKRERSFISSSYTGPRTTYLNDRDRPFYFGPVLPPNKLEYFAALAKDTCGCDPTLCKTKTIRGDISHGSAFLVSQPLSLIDPVLPFGYGFALVDRTGLVLFHSDKTLSGIESFRQQTDWNNELYAALFGQASQRSVPLNYKGRAYSARVFSIPAPRNRQGR